VEKGWNLSGGLVEDDRATGAGVDNLWFQELYVAQVFPSASKCVDYDQLKRIARRVKFPITVLRSHRNGGN
jgi:hypothetical protein